MSIQPYARCQEPQQCEPHDCERNAHEQQERLVAAETIKEPYAPLFALCRPHRPPALCRASAVALSAMILTIAAATAG